MKQKLILTSLLASISIYANSQITKNNWLIGGNITFSSSEFSNDLGKNTAITTEIDGKIGYFFIDKLSIGLKPSLGFYKYKASTNTKQSDIHIGPFVRYYFLSSESQINFLAEAGYGFGTTKVPTMNSIKSHSFSFMGGPVLFLNTSVAMELLIGYSQVRSNNENSTQKTIRAGIGFQYHLEKE